MLAEGRRTSTAAPGFEAASSAGLPPGKRSCDATAGCLGGSEPPRPALESPSRPVRDWEDSPREGASDTSNVAALKAEPEAFDSGEPTGSKAWPRMTARISHSAAIAGRCGCAERAVADCR